MTFDAALIAGGRSARFGEDKAFLDWNGLPLYARQLQVLASLKPQNIFLSANRDQPFPNVLEGVRVVLDEVQDAGPIGGLVRVFEQSGADYILVLGVDLPCMSPAFLESMLDKRGGVVPKNESYWEPLAAIYPREEMLRLFQAAIERGERKLQDILDAAFGEGIFDVIEIGAADKDYFRNLNTKNDLDALSPSVFDQRIEIARHRVGASGKREQDFVAAEEPLEIRVNDESVAVVMRTPGYDEELAVGFLLTEGLLSSPDEVLEIVHCPDVDPQGLGNTLDIRVLGEPDLGDLTRHVFTSSSCGVCGKATIDAVFLQFPPVETVPELSPEFLLSLPEKLRESQKTFDRTGGLHASALFDDQGELLLLREDVGRHNALDKVIGRAFLDRIDLSATVLLVSGRISFELMQKALSARIPAVAGISAPSSLAVRLARESGQFLAGFLREKSFNVYSGELSK